MSVQVVLKSESWNEGPWIVFRNLTVITVNHVLYGNTLSLVVVLALHFHTSEPSANVLLFCAQFHSHSAYVLSFGTSYHFIRSALSVSCFEGSLHLFWPILVVAERSLKGIGHGPEYVGAPFTLIISGRSQFAITRVHLFLPLHWPEGYSAQKVLWWIR